MLQGPEQVMGVPKIPQSQMELRPIWVDTRVAQELGLQDHQIIQATVVLQDKSVRLWLKDFSFEIPYTWNVKPGDMPFVSVRAMPGAWSIQLQSNPLGPTAPNVPQAQTNALGAAGAALVHGANVPTLGLNGASVAASAQALINSPQLLGSRLLMLQQQPSGFEMGSQLMRPDLLSQMSAQLGVGAWFENFRKLTLSMSQVSGLALKKAVLSQAQSSENSLLKGMDASDSPKAMLHKLMDALNQLGHNSHTDQKLMVQRSIDEIESAQLRAVQDFARGELSLRVVIPFSDADPVDLHFRKPPREEGQPDTPLSVDIHSKSRLLGEVWLQTIITQTTQVDLRMWALRPEVAQLAHDNASELTYELDASGLKLKTFEIFNAQRPLEESDLITSAHGRVVDAKV